MLESMSFTNLTIERFAPVCLYFAQPKFTNPLPLKKTVIVGIMVDYHNSPVPVIAVFDAFNQFKNLSRGRHVIHTYFNRFQPTSITHDFTADEVNSLSQELFRYLNVKSAMQQMEGNTTIRPLIYNMKLKLIKCLF